MLQSIAIVRVMIRLASMTLNTFLTWKDVWNLLWWAKCSILQLNTFGLPNSNAIKRDPTKLRIAGDVRVNVAPTLLVLHTLFVKEHNRLATVYKKKHPKASAYFLIFQWMHANNNWMYNFLSFLYQLLGCWELSTCSSVGLRFHYSVFAKRPWHENGCLQYSFFVHFHFLCSYLFSNWGGCADLAPSWQSQQDQRGRFYFQFRKDKHAA